MHGIFCLKIIDGLSHMMVHGLYYQIGEWENHYPFAWRLNGVTIFYGYK
jgi:hypothetical protein